MVSGETAIEASNLEEVIGPYNPWHYLKANFSQATPPGPTPETANGPFLLAGLLTLGGFGRQQLKR